MRYVSWTVLMLVALTAVPGRAVEKAVGTAAQRSGATEWRPGVSFEANVGQFPAEARFVARQRGFTLVLTDTGALVFPEITAGDASSGVTRPIRLQVENGIARRPTGHVPQDGHINYLIGNDPTTWHRGVRTFARVLYEDVQPGVDLVYYGREGTLEYDLVVAAGVDASRLAMTIDGADAVELDAGGHLRLTLGAGTFTMRAPEVFQVRDGARHTVQAHYRVDAPGRVAFDLGEYDPDAPLVIDPQLVYGTFLGGSGDRIDQLFAVDVDAEGNAYVVGMTETTDYPTDRSLQPHRGNSEAVITKLTPDGRRVYSTYLGGTGYDGATDVAVRADGTVYVIGDTSSRDFPIRDAFQRELAGATDVFVAELSRDGESLVRATYLGGGDVDLPGGLQLARRSEPPEAWRSVVTNVFDDWVVVYGSTRSPNFPTVLAAQDRRVGERDGFLTVLDRTTLRPLLSTYVGRQGDNLVQGMVLNRARGDVYLWIQRNDDQGPMMVRLRPAEASSGTSRLREIGELVRGIIWIVFVTTEIEIENAKAASLQPRCPGRDYWEYRDRVEDLVDAQEACLIPSFIDQAATADTLRRAHVTVTIPGCLPDPPARTCDQRAAILYYDQDLRLLGHTNLGGRRLGRQFAPSRTVFDWEGQLHMIGATTDTQLPVVSPVQASNAGSSEGFVLTQDAAGETTFLSYLGGRSFDTLSDIAVDTDGNRWIVGTTQSADFPVSRSGVQTELRGRIDGFVVKISR